MIILQTIIGWKSDLFPIFHIRRPGEPCGQCNTISKIKTGFRKPDRDQRSGSENVLSLNKNCVGSNSKEILLISGAAYSIQVDQKYQTKISNI